MQGSLGCERRAEPLGGALEHRDGLGGLAGGQQRLPGKRVSCGQRRAGQLRELDRRHRLAGRSAERGRVVEHPAHLEQRPGQDDVLLGVEPAGHGHGQLEVVTARPENGLLAPLCVGEDPFGDVLGELAQAHHAVLRPSVEPVGLPAHALQEEPSERAVAAAPPRVLERPLVLPGRGQVGHPCLGLAQRIEIAVHRGGT